MANDLSSLYRRVRSHSLSLCRGLETEDFCIQPAIEASPPKWHLAHTTWFFETFLLLPLVTAYQRQVEAYGYLFNSYYEGIGQQWPREERGKLSRPTVREIMEYREHVDRALLELLDAPGNRAQDIFRRTLLGLHHEQQHQELLVTDIKRNFGANPLNPCYQASGIELTLTEPSEPIEFVEFDGGLTRIGVAAERSQALEFSDFSFDNETPEHQVYLGPFAIASRLSTNGEYLEFIEDGGYQRPELWLAEAWSRITREGWAAPLYWTSQDGEWFEYRLSGRQPLDRSQRVAHLSYYEADAFARWQGVRLPTEAEWEHSQLPAGNPVLGEAFGRLWQWTSSAYGPYPGFRQWAGPVGEYNGKFMSGQMVLRGSSCATPDGHARTSYRNFFYPWDRWQYMGVRLAKDSSPVISRGSS